MNITADYVTKTNGVRVLHFMRNGKNWYADVGFPKEQFIIGAQVAYFISANFDRVKEFADSDGNMPEKEFMKEISMGRGYIEQVMWCRREDFEIGDKTIHRPFLKLEWSKGRTTGTFNFGVEKAKAMLMFRSKISEFASTYA